MEYGLIGGSLKHSYSREIHNKLRDYDYELVSLSEAELIPFAQQHDFKGINVTIPYKLKIIPFCKTLSDCAQRIGSVNTVTVDGQGNLHGYNTDYSGFLYMTDRAGIDFSGKKVIILGSGGTSLTAHTAAKDRGAAKITTVSRDGEHNYGNISELYDYDIIVNATPVGMYPRNGEKLVDLTKFGNCRGVVDVIYNPLSTALLQQAQKLCIPNTNGLSMLVAQAKYSSDIFTGEKIDDGEIERVCAEMTAEFSNIVLVGMAGSGKTTVGRLLAERLNRAFVDTDNLIETQSGMTIPEIFTEHDEDYFRSLEHDVIVSAGREHGCVIATGGGAILREDNCDALRQNGKIIWLKRDPELLETQGRPLSKDAETVKNLYTQREPRYSACSDFTIENSGGNPADAVNKIAEVLCL